MTRATPRDCSVAAALEVIGDRWSLLAVRELSLGVTRFNDVAANTGAPRDILTSRLRKLEDQGVVRREQYSDRPPRFDYVLTESGVALAPVLSALRRWGDEHLVDGPPPVQLEHSCGKRYVAEPHCQACGEITVPGSLHLARDESGHRIDGLPRQELDVRSRHALPRHGHGALLRRKKPALRGVFERHGVTDVRVFGSAARGDDRSDSDIDFVVHPSDGVDLLDLAALILELEDVLGVRVDVVPDTSLRPGVAVEIESDAVPL